LNSGDYRLAVPINGFEKLIVLGKARLYCTRPIAISGQAYLLVGTSGTASSASIEIYARSNVVLSGRGVINGTAIARNFSLIGLSNCVSVTYSGSTPLIGTIYAPRADVGMTGVLDTVGAVAGNTVTITGGMGLHFDEDLKRSGPF